MAQINLYNQIKLDAPVTISPDKLDSNIDDHILSTLKRKIEGKTVESGVVVKIFGLVDYKRGIVSSTDFMAPITFDVTYECLLCFPKSGLEIICSVEQIVKGYIIARNGPVIAALQLSYVDMQKFTVNDKDIIRKSDNKKVEKGNCLKAIIINSKFSLGERDIYLVCKMIDFANDNEIKRFENEKKLISKTNSDQDNVFI